MDKVLKGGCLCGKQRYTITLEGPVEDLYGDYCHCGQCRKLSGSVMAAFLTVSKKNFTYEGQPKMYRSSENGYRVFCEECGSQLTWQGRDVDEIDVGIGTLDEPEKGKPKTHLWVENKILINLDLPKYLQSAKGELLKE